MTVNFHVHRPLQSHETGIVSISLAHGSLYQTLRNRTSSARLSIGLHPWDVATADLPRALSHIESAAAMADAIGECGLDLFIIKGHEEREALLAKQMEAFEAQLQMADRLKKPVILHVVRAAEPLLAMRKKFSEQTWVVHGFRGPADLARRYIEAGIYLSFGPALLHEKDHSTCEAFRSVPADRLFLETDDSDVDIRTLYQRGASLRDIAEQALEEIVRQNFYRLFPLPTVETAQ